MKVECFCNHFSLAIFSSQKETRYENHENRHKKTNKTIKKTKPKFVSVFFCFLFYFLNPSITSFFISQHPLLINLPSSLFNSDINYKFTALFFSFFNS